MELHTPSVNLCMSGIVAYSQMTGVAGAQLKCCLSRLLCTTMVEALASPLPQVGLVVLLVC